MEPGSQRWRQVSSSQYPSGVDALNALLAGAESFHAWTCFQFTDGARIHEVHASATPSTAGRDNIDMDLGGLSE